MALGAQKGDVMRLVLRHGVWMLIVGETVGLAGAIALNKLIESMVFGVRTTDPLTYAVTSSVWAVTALLACYIPARKATTVDPITALRCE